MLEFLQYFEFLRKHAPNVYFFQKFERRFETKRRSASQRRPVDWPRRELAIEGIFFDPMPIFDIVMAGQRLISAIWRSRPNRPNLNFGDLAILEI